MKMENLNFLSAITYDSSSPFLLKTEIIQGLITSAVVALLSLIFIAPLTARWVRWENEKTWKKIRGKLKYDFSKLITETVESINYTYSYFDIYNGKDDYIFNCCDTIVIFCEHQKIRVSHFKEAFSNFNDALHPDERYWISRFISDEAVFDSQRLSSLADAALTLMAKLKADPDLTIKSTSEYFEIRPLRQCVTIIPDTNKLISASANISNLDLTKLKSIVNSDRFYRDNEKKKSNQQLAAELQMFISEIIDQDVYKKDMMLYKFISDTLDIPQLQNRNHLVFS